LLEAPTINPLDVPIGSHWQVNYNGFEPEKKKKPEITEATIDPSEIGLVAWLALFDPLANCVFWGVLGIQTLRGNENSEASQPALFGMDHL